MKLRRDMRRRIAFLFALGHGHATQFVNMQEASEEESSLIMEWIGIDGKRSSQRWRKMLPDGLNYRGNEVVQARSRISAHDDWSALFIACENVRVLDLGRKFPSYFYTDLTPSLKVSLSPWYSHQLGNSPTLQALRTLAHARVYRSARGVFAMSRWAARGVEGDYGVDPQRIHVSLPGANLRSFPFVDRSERSGFAGVKLLMVGGEFRRKGGPRLLDWARRTETRGWELDIVTWPGDLPDWISGRLGQPAADGHVVASLGPELPTVRVHCGLVANAPALMRLYEQADIFVLPTQADGSSIASLEAMASGLPVVVGAVGGIPELIEHGKTGFLVDAGEEASFEAQMEELISDASLRLSVGRRARRACEEHLNVTRQLREIMTILERDGNA